MDNKFIESITNNQQTDTLKQIDSEIEQVQTKLEELKVRRSEVLTNFQSPIIQALKGMKWVVFIPKQIPSEIKREPLFLEFAVRSFVQTVSNYRGNYKTAEHINESFLDDAVFDILFSSASRLPGFENVDFFNVDWKSYLKKRLSLISPIITDSVTLDIEVLLVRIKK